MNDKFDLIIVGSSFSATFFLYSYLRKAKKSSRVLVIESGKQDIHSWQLKNKRSSSRDNSDIIINNNSKKKWAFTIGFGGGSNCWWAGTPRMLPSDFELRSRYGQGKDWPINYNELEPYYSEAEKLMQVSGPDYGNFIPRSIPYPQPPHKFNKPDTLMKQAYPGLYYQQPSARPRIATLNRPQCCANGTCHLCPIDAKFSIQNEMNYLYKDHRVQLLLDSTVQAVMTDYSHVTGVVYNNSSTTHKAYADLVVLGANALFNPHILLNSGVQHPLLGKLLNEQISYDVMVDLDDVEGFQGSTSITGHSFHLYDGLHRKKRAACLIESNNVPSFLRMERGKWSHRMILRCIVEDLPSENNFLTVHQSHPSKIEINYKGHSAYTQKTIDRLPDELAKILNPLPVEKIHPLRRNRSDGHIQGTTVMGNDPTDSIIDRHLIHHKYRNLVVLGSGAFPTCPPANPTLTLSALSLWSADYLFN